VASQPAIGLRLVSAQVVQHHVQLAARMVRHDLVHEVEEFPSPSPIIVAGFHVARGHVQSCAQGGRPEGRIGRKAPTATTTQRNPVLAQDPPHLVLTHIAQRLGQQMSRPRPMTRWGRLLQQSLLRARVVAQSDI
jgi:hypothetical protein